MTVSRETSEALAELAKPSNTMANAIVSAMFAQVRAELRTFKVMPDVGEAGAELTAALYAYLKASAPMARPVMLLDGESEGLD